jgi:hypothetical protein
MTAFLPSSAKKRRKAKGISRSHVLISIECVANILFPHGWYTMKNWSISSKPMPTNISLFVNKPILKTDSLDVLQARTLPVCVMMIEVRQAVVAFLRKPFGKLELIAAIHKLMQPSRSAHP